MYKFHTTPYILRCLASALVLLLFVQALMVNTPFAHGAASTTQPTTTEESQIDDEVDEEDATTTEETDDEQTSTTTEQDGDAGEDGTDNGDGDAVVKTGDATASADIESSANTNETDVEFSSSSNATSSTDGSATTTDGASSTTEPFGFGSDNDAEVNATNTNDAAITTDADVAAETGANSAGGGTAIIDTGNAYAVANVVNLANTNILNSNGFIEFFSSLGFSTIDLRDIFGVFDNAQSTSPCLQTVCGDDAHYTVSNDNNATITNNINVTATTGDNTATGTDGAVIQTGNAYAAANVLNIANTNITDSNYLILSFSNLGDMEGDIVMPNGSAIAELFDNSGAGGAASVLNENSANVSNNTAVEANTGDNSTNGGTTVTGDAQAHSNVTNTINQNFFGADRFLLVIRVHGNWDGSVHGLPDGLQWAETPQGIQIFSESDSGGAGSGQHTVTNKNTANIDNNVSVLALTGENKATGSASGIATGDAYAGSNIMNIVNTNVLGQNWALLIFDIFGNWGGNITFGRPDLWVGATAKSPDSPIMPGSSVEYTFTVMNRGDTAAHNVTLENAFPKGHLQFGDDGLVDVDAHTRGMEHEIGTLAPGDSREIRVKGAVDDTLHPRKEVTIDMFANVFARESEDNTDNNQDVVSIVSGKERGGGPFGLKLPANIEIEKIADVNTTTVPATVEYTITLTNHGGPVYEATLRDELTNEEGTTVSEDSWKLETIENGETVEISYDLDFAEGTSPGTYTNTARLAGFHRAENLNHRQLYLSDPVEATIEIEGGEGAVLGASSDTCPPYLEDFLKMGDRNDRAQVERLQSFLKETEGMDLSVTGIFDRTTHAAVQAFQSKYAEDVLTPWGMSAPSGYVYLTTQKKINELACGGAQTFPLTRAQRTEIERYRFASDVPFEPAQRGSVVTDDAAAIVPQNRNDNEASEDEKDVAAGPPGRDEQEEAAEHVRSSFLDWVKKGMGSLFGGISLR